MPTAQLLDLVSENRRRIVRTAANGGPIAAVREGDTMDANRGVLYLDIAAEEVKRRLAEWKAPAPRYNMGVMAKYCKLGGERQRGRGHAGVRWAGLWPRMGGPEAHPT